MREALRRSGPERELHEPDGEDHADDEPDGADDQADAKALEKLRAPWRHRAPASGFADAFEGRECRQAASRARPAPPQQIHVGSNTPVGVRTIV